MALGDYSKTTYVNGSAPGINATRLNNNENKTEELDTELSGHIGAGGAEHPAATTSVAGFLSASDKAKLNGIVSTAKQNGYTTYTGSLNGNTSTTKYIALNSSNYKKGIMTIINSNDKHLGAFITFNTDSLDTKAYATLINADSSGAVSRRYIGFVLEPYSAVSEVGSHVCGDSNIGIDDLYIDTNNSRIVIVIKNGYSTSQNYDFRVDWEAWTT